MDKYCKNCGDGFLPAESNQIFCCKKCCSEYHRDEYHLKKENLVNDGDINICKNCNEKFEMRRRYPNQIYCTKKCAREASKKQQAEAMSESNYYRIFERDVFRCAYCGKTSYEDDVKLMLDHVHPRSKGGKDVSSNLITSCSRCNLMKHTKVMKKTLMNNVLAEVERRNKLFGFNGKEIIKL